jgi:hypothetical protein
MNAAQTLPSQVGEVRLIVLRTFVREMWHPSTQGIYGMWL